MFVLDKSYEIEYDGKFTDKYIFKHPNPKLFVRCDIMKIFPEVVQLYLSHASERSHNLLLTEGFSLRIQLIPTDDCSFAEVVVVSNNGYNSPFIRRVFNDLPHVFLIPCEISLGPYPHFMALIKDYIIERDINQEFTWNNKFYDRGMLMLGRVQYEGETDIESKEIEQGIFIIPN